ncbi:hypothetical protein L596_014213 [Steinernema carpocapsae]|uniref:Transcription factor AP-2 C-terminal domain-containing protein n=1 Tax=Steinernema carpocapsae TaxID=34508 RepID=A0A4U5NBT1_STECR|nr:hypothetical protein L596_014213 [Steinernema carpocapsae]
MTDTITKQLAEAGLQIPKGRRRKTELTLFSAMSEAESVKLVSDFEKLAISISRPRNSPPTGTTRTKRSSARSL